MTDHIDIRNALDSVEKWLRDASSSAESVFHHNEWFMQDDLSNCIERSFLALITICEITAMSTIRQALAKDYQEASLKGTFHKINLDPEQDAYVKWEPALSNYLSVMKSMLGLGGSATVNRNLLEIIRNLQYAVTDKRCFKSPENEADFHDRAEMVLKCVFTDLKRKPSVSKTLKNFFPDTGIPSMKTLIEYKYLDSKDNVDRISDEILADTRGYISNEWNKFVYVVYETERFRPERDWQKHLRDCDTAKNTEIVVICGEKATSRRVKKKVTKKAKTTPKRAS